MIEGDRVDTAEAGATVAVVTNQTPFYGESGGQTGDTGILFDADGAEVAITDTLKRLGDLHVHVGEVKRGKISIGDVMELRVDTTWRDDLRAHHSATHLLHQALRRHLGDHVTQKGSMVAADRLRFDISHPKAIDPAVLGEIEREVNARIRGNSDVSTRLMTPDAAAEEGAMALFGEKYGDEVRVVTMGGNESGAYSVELCGGTHVARTGDIGAFRILGDSALAAGVRRIEAVAAGAADAHAASREDLISRAAAELRVAPVDVPDRIAALLDERRSLERELSDTRRKLATGGGGESDEDFAKEISGVKFAAVKVEDVPARELKPMADDLKQRIGSGVVAIVAIAEGKASLVVGVTDDLTDRLDAVQFVRAGSAALGGKGGGGRPDMARAGGPDGTAADAALAAIESALDESA